MKELCIISQNGVIQAALIEDGLLSEYYAESAEEFSRAGNIYKGKVVNVLPGMQAAFINIGLDKNAFLCDGNNIKSLKPGGSIMVRLLKNQSDAKGAHVTAEITLPGKYLVLVPNGNSVSVSGKIADQAERERLKRLVPDNYGYGFIIRTAALTAQEREILGETDTLISIWEKIKYDYLRKSAPAEIYTDGSLLTRIQKEIHDIDKIAVNDNALKDIFPTAVVADAFGEEIKKQIERIYDRRIELKNGGYLFFDKTEALTVIDVNTGKYSGGKDFEDTVFNTNLIAAQEIARQIRLRDIGGIIIIDFIDMHDKAHKDQVLSALSETLKNDRQKTYLAGITNLGLVEITRKKIKT